MRNFQMKTRVYFLLTIITMIIFSCKTDDTDNPAPVNPGELITTVRLLLSDSISGLPLDTISYSDIDGSGGNAPLTDTLFLSQAQTVAVEVLVLDESQSPADTISNEIFSEGDTHQFVYLSNLVGTQINDTDMNGFPIGLSLFVNGISSGNGDFRLQLRHYNSASDKAAGNSSYSTDIDILFPLKVQ